MELDNSPSTHPNKHSQNTDSAALNKSQIAELEKVQTLTKIIYSQFKEHKAAVIGAYTILFFVLVALSAPLIEKVTGLDAETQNVFNRYKPPFTTVSVSLDARHAEIKNFISTYPTESLQIQKSLIQKELVTGSEEDALYEWARYEKRKAFVAIKYLDTTDEAKDALKDITKKFETQHILGTDELGRDVLMRLIYGTRISMGVGILVALSAAFIGLLVGSIAGYYGGVLDSLLMRLTDSLLSLPLIPVLIVVSAIDLRKLPFFSEFMSTGSENILKLVVLLCLFSWMPVSRLVRGSILSLREREFILAAKTLGASDFTIITRHMFPNVIAPLLVSVTLGVGESILFEAALSFLGLGIQPPTPSWGNMLFNAQELIYQAPSLAILPGLLILFVTISFNYVGDGLQDAIDPKTIKR